MIKTKYIFYGLAVIMLLFSAAWLGNFVSPFASFGLILFVAISINIYLNIKKSKLKKNEKS